MIIHLKKFNHTLWHRLVSGMLSIAFLSSSIVLPTAHAQVINFLPQPGTMVTLSPGFSPVLMKGLKLHPQNPFQFDFVIDTGDTHVQDEALREEANKLIKYFLAALTVPEDEMWVNLSPFEKDRIIPENFGTTEMGRDMLAQDYILKQLTASLMYPEKELGEAFWKKIREQAYAKYGTTEIPMETFNKVWIVPDHAVVYEYGDMVFVTDSHLKVMLEEDYHAYRQAGDEAMRPFDVGERLAVSVQDHDVAMNKNEMQNVIREIIIPAIEKEVNEGENFNLLRQMCHSLILSTWYKRNLKQTILSRVYVDQNKVAGVDLEDKQIKQKIYEKYLEAFKVGVYDYIKEDYDPVNQTIIPRKYFSGGLQFKLDNASLDVEKTDLEDAESVDRAQIAIRQALFGALAGSIFMVGANVVKPESLDAAQVIEDADRASVNETPDQLGIQHYSDGTVSFEGNIEEILDLSALRKYLLENIVLYHGTSSNNLESIREHGLDPMYMPFDPRETTRVQKLYREKLNKEHPFLRRNNSRGVLNLTHRLIDAEDYARNGSEAIKVARDAIREILDQVDNLSVSDRTFLMDLETRYDDWFKTSQPVILAVPLGVVLQSDSQLTQIAQILDSDESFSMHIETLKSFGLLGENWSAAEFIDVFIHNFKDIQIKKAVKRDTIFALKETGKLKKFQSIADFSVEGEVPQKVYYLNPRTIADVKQIVRRSDNFQSRDEIIEYVEEPLVPAVQQLYDLGIRTLTSSANPKDLKQWIDGDEQTYGYLTLDEMSLSESQQNVLLQLSEADFALDGAGVKVRYMFGGLAILFPMTSETLIEDIIALTLKITEAFGSDNMNVSDLSSSSDRAMFNSPQFRNLVLFLSMVFSTVNFSGDVIDGGRYSEADGENNIADTMLDSNISTHQLEIDGHNQINDLQDIKLLISELKEDKFPEDFDVFSALNSLLMVIEPKNDYSRKYQYEALDFLSSFRFDDSNKSDAYTSLSEHEKQVAKDQYSVIVQRLLLDLMKSDKFNIDDEKLFLKVMENISTIGGEPNALNEKVLEGLKGVVLGFKEFEKKSVIAESVVLQAILILVKQKDAWVLTEVSQMFSGPSHVDAKFDIFNISQKLHIAREIMSNVDDEILRRKAQAFLQSRAVLDEMYQGLEKNGINYYSSINLGIILEYSSVDRVIQRFLPSQDITPLTSEELKVANDFVYTLGYLSNTTGSIEITESQEQYMLDFYIGVMKTLTANDIDKISQIYTTLSSKWLYWLRFLDGEMIRIVRDAVNSLSDDVTPESLVDYIKVYEIQLRFRALRDISLDDVEAKLQRINSAHIDREFLDQIQFNSATDFALVFNFIQNYLKDDELLDYVYKRSSKLFFNFDDLANLEFARKEINKTSSTLGDQMIRNASLIYINHEMADDQLSVESLEDKIRLANRFRNPSSYVTRDIEGFYQVIGNFMMSRISDFTAENATALMKAWGEERFEQHVNDLIEDGFFDQEESQFNKLRQQLSRLNIRYLKHKAGILIKGKVSKENLDLNPEGYSLSPSQEYQLEEGAEILELRESDSDDVLAYVVKLDSNKGGRVEFSADVGRIDGGISGLSLMKEIDGNGRLIVDFPLSFTTGDAKPTEMMIEDGIVENDLVSVEGKDGWIFIYRDRTVHITDKRKLMISDIVRDIPSDKDRRLDVLKRVEDYVLFVELSRQEGISLVSNMLLYDGQEIAQLNDGPDQRRFFVEFEDGSFGMVNPTKDMSTNEAVRLAIIAGATKVVYADTGQFDYTTFRPLNGDEVIWGHSDQKESSNRIGLYMESIDRAELSLGQIPPQYNDELLREIYYEVTEEISDGLILKAKKGEVISKQDLIDAIEKISGAYVNNFKGNPEEVSKIENVTRQLVSEIRNSSPSDIYYTFPIALAAMIDQQAKTNGNAGYANIYFPRDMAFALPIDLSLDKLRNLVDAVVNESFLRAKTKEEAATNLKAAVANMDILMATEPKDTIPQDSNLQSGEESNQIFNTRAPPTTMSEAFNLALNRVTTANNLEPIKTQNEAPNDKTSNLPGSPTLISPSPQVLQSLTSLEVALTDQTAEESSEQPKILDVNPGLEFKKEIARRIDALVSEKDSGIEEITGKIKEQLTEMIISLQNNVAVLDISFPIIDPKESFFDETLTLSGQFRGERDVSGGIFNDIISKLKDTEISERGQSIARRFGFGDDMESGLLHLSRASFGSENYMWASRTIDALVANKSSKKDFMHAFVKVLEAKMKESENFRKAIEKLENQLVVLGYDKARAIRFVDTGYKTFPLLMEAVVNRKFPGIRTDSLAMNSSVRFLSKLDTSQWSEGVRRAINAVGNVRQYAYPSWGPMENAQSTFLHPMRYSFSQGKILPTSPSDHITSHLRTMQFVLGAINYRRLVEGIQGDLVSSDINSEKASKMSQKIVGDIIGIANSKDSVTGLSTSSIQTTVGVNEESMKETSSNSLLDQLEIWNELKLKEEEMIRLDALISYFREQYENTVDDLENIELLPTDTFNEKTKEFAALYNYLSQLMFDRQKLGEAVGALKLKAPEMESSKSAVESSQAWVQEIVPGFRFSPVTLKMIDEIAVGKEKMDKKVFEDLAVAHSWEELTNITPEQIRVISREKSKFRHWLMVLGVLSLLTATGHNEQIRDLSYDGSITDPLPIPTFPSLFDRYGYIRLNDQGPQIQELMARMDLIMDVERELEALNSLSNNITGRSYPVENAKRVWQSAQQGDIFDWNVQRVVIAFQEVTGISEDGVWGPESEAKSQELLLQQYLNLQEIDRAEMSDLTSQLQEVERRMKARDTAFVIINGQEFSIEDLTVGFVSKFLEAEFFGRRDFVVRLKNPDKFDEFSQNIMSDRRMQVADALDEYSEDEIELELGTGNVIKLQSSEMKDAILKGELVFFTDYDSENFESTLYLPNGFSFEEFTERIRLRRIRKFQQTDYDSLPEELKILLQSHLLREEGLIHLENLEITAAELKTGFDHQWLIVELEDDGRFIAKYKDEESKTAYQESVLEGRNKAARLFDDNFSKAEGTFHILGMDAEKSTVTVEEASEAILLGEIIVTENTETKNLEDVEKLVGLNSSTGNQITLTLTKGFPIWQFLVRKRQRQVQKETDRADIVDVPEEDVNASQQVVQSVKNSLLRRGHGLLGKEYIDYYDAIGKVTNPNAGEFVVASGGAGADISTVFLKTRFTKAYFLDQVPVRLSRLLKAIQNSDEITKTWNMNSYVLSKRSNGYSVYDFFKDDIEDYLIAELIWMGVSPDQMRVRTDAKGRLVLEFTLPGDNRTREITFINYDLLDEKQTLPELNGQLDAYHENALFQLMEEHPNHLQSSFPWLKPSGFILVNPFSAYGSTDKKIDLNDVISPFAQRYSPEDIQGKAASILSSTENKLHYGWEMEIWRTAQSDRTEINVSQIEFGLSEIPEKSFIKKFEKSHGKAVPLTDEQAKKISYQVVRDLDLSWYEWDSKFPNSQGSYFFNYGEKKYKRGNGLSVNQANVKPVFIRIGYLFFIELEEYLKLPEETKTLLGSNCIIVEDKKTTDLVMRGNQYYTTGTIIQMLEGDIGEFDFIDSGAGKGILSLVASKLGAPFLDLIEIMPSSLSAAQRLLLINGLVKDEDFALHLGSITDRIFMGKVSSSISARVSQTGHQIVLGSNIAHWPELYTATNTDSMRLITDLPQIRKVILAGYNVSTFRTNHDPIIQDKEQLGELGFTISPNAVKIGGSIRIVSFMADFVSHDMTDSFDSATLEKRIIDLVQSTEGLQDALLNSPMSIFNESQKNRLRIVLGEDEDVVSEENVEPSGNVPNIPTSELRKIYRLIDSLINSQLWDRDSQQIIALTDVENFEDQFIQMLFLPSMVANALWDHDIRTIESLLSKTEQDLHKISNISIGGVSAIKMALARNNLSLRKSNLKNELGEFPTYNDLKSHTVRELNISARLSNLLIRNRLTSLSSLMNELATTTKNGFMKKIRGLGPVGYQQLITALEEAGLSIPDKDESDRASFAIPWIQSMIKFTDQLNSGAEEGEVTNDGKWLLMDYGYQTPAILYSVDKLREEENLGDIFDPRFSSDSRYLAWIEKFSGQLVIRQLTDGQMVEFNLQEGLENVEDYYFISSESRGDNDENLTTTRIYVTFESSENRSPILLDLQTRQKIPLSLDFDVDQSVRPIVFPGGRYLLIRDAQKFEKIFDMNNPSASEKLNELTGEGSIDIIVSDNEKYMLAYDEDNILKIIDLGKLDYLQVPIRNVLDYAFSPSGQFLVYTTADGKFIQLDLVSMIKKEVNLGTARGIHVHVSPDSEWAAVIPQEALVKKDQNGEEITDDLIRQLQSFVYIIHLTTGEMKRIDLKNLISEFIWLPDDGNFMVTFVGEENNRIQTFKAQTGEVLPGSEEVTLLRSDQSAEGQWEVSLTEDGYVEFTDLMSNIAGRIPISLNSHEYFDASNPYWLKVKYQYEDEDSSRFYSIEMLRDIVALGDRLSAVSQVIKLTDQKKGQKLLDAIRQLEDSQTLTDYQRKLVELEIEIPSQLYAVGWSEQIVRQLFALYKYLNEEKSDSLKSILEQTLGYPLDIVESGFTDSAQIDDPVGGIDFNPSNLTIESQGKMDELNVPLYLQSPENININGLTPVIFQIIPVNSLPMLLGINQEESQNQLSLAR